MTPRRFAKTRGWVRLANARILTSQAGYPVLSRTRKAVRVEVVLSNRQTHRFWFPIKVLRWLPDDFTHIYLPPSLVESRNRDLERLSLPGRLEVAA